MVNQICEHKWTVWPETDGREQKCTVCGAYRATPASELPAVAQPENMKIVSYNKAITDVAEELETAVALLEEQAEATEGFQHFAIKSRASTLQNAVDLVREMLIPRLSADEYSKLRNKLHTG